MSLSFSLRSKAQTQKKTGAEKPSTSFFLQPGNDANENSDDADALKGRSSFRPVTFSGPSRLVEAQRAKALEEDASVFKYDEALADVPLPSVVTKPRLYLGAGAPAEDTDYRQDGNTTQGGRHVPVSKAARSSGSGTAQLPKATQRPQRRPSQESPCAADSADPEKDTGLLLADTGGSTATKPSRFIAALMKTAERRQLEKEIIQEKMLQKEREKEADEFGIKEAFVTEAYKRRLVERKQAARDIALQDMKDAQKDVKKMGTLTHFHAHLLRSSQASRSHHAQEATSDTVTNIISGPAEMAEPANSSAADVPIIEENHAAPGDMHVQHPAVSKLPPASPLPLISSPVCKNSSDETIGPRLAPASTSHAPACEPESLLPPSAAEPSPPCVSLDERAELARQRYLQRKKQRRDSEETSG
eukprot:GHVT01063445.1.p1 GENE.GHVT01063445.1~~GHVT01063445.1.p1  ORF type:complete len:417 (+),score=72.89 GHVT01063445.1:330-1580(+)